MLDARGLEQPEVADHLVGGADRPAGYSDKKYPKDDKSGAKPKKGEKPAKP